MRGSSAVDAPSGRLNKILKLGAPWVAAAKGGWGEPAGNFLGLRDPILTRITRVRRRVQGSP